MEPAFASPSTPKLSIPPYKPGLRICCAALCNACDSRPRYDTHDTFGCCSSHLPAAHESAVGSTARCSLELQQFGPADVPSKFKGVLRVAFCTQAERLEALEEEERGEGAHTRAKVTQHDLAADHCVCCSTEGSAEDAPMVPR